MVRVSVDFQIRACGTGGRSDVESGGGESRMAAYGLIGGKNRIAGPGNGKD